MFEVDWKDYQCERVGERRARKELKREQKNERANSGHQAGSIISSRAQGSKGHPHRNFSGSITRRKTAASPRSHGKQSFIPEIQTAKANEQLKNSSERLSGSSMTSILCKGKVSPRFISNELRKIEPSANLKGAPDIAESMSPDSPDRWSKGNHLANHRFKVLRLTNE